MSAPTPSPSGARITTLELPVVRGVDDSDPALAPVPAAAPISADAPAPGRAAAPLPAPVAPRRPPRPAGRRSRAVVTMALLAGAAVAGVAVGVQGWDGRPAPSASADATAVPLSAESVSSVDPSGGSGFRTVDGGGWRTQTYTTAQFGNLKDGVGLLVDVGTARELSSVTLEGASAGLAVELRASESPGGGADAFQPVDARETAGEATVLDATGAPASRYWLVWVTGLAPADGGFAAEVGGLDLQGPPA